MILEIYSGDPNNVVRKYFKDRSDISINSLSIRCKLFDDDGNEIPLYIKKVKPIVEEEKVDIENTLDDFLSQGE